MAGQEGPFTAQVQQALGILPTYATTSLPTSQPIGSLVFDTTASSLKVSTDGTTWTAVGTFSGGAITSPILAANGTAAAPSYSFTNFPTSGMYAAAGPTLGFSTGGTQGFNLTASQLIDFAQNNTTAAITNSFGSAKITFPNTGNLTLLSGSGVGININSVNFGVVQFGGADAAAPVAQTLQVQSVVAGTSNTAGQPFIIRPSLSTGTGAGGEIQRAYAKTGASGTTQNAATANAYNIPGTIFTVASAVNVNNSAAETSLLTGTLVGTATIEANVLRVGRAIHCIFRGIIANTGTPTFRARLTLGATTLIDTTAFTTAAITGTQGWKFECDLVAYTLGASGTLAASGMFFYDTTLSNVIGIDAPNASTVTLDTTAAEAIDLKITWGAASASNTVTLQTGYAVYLN